MEKKEVRNNAHGRGEQERGREGFLGPDVLKGDSRGVKRQGFLNWEKRGWHVLRNKLLLEGLEGHRGEKKEREKGREKKIFHSSKGGRRTRLTSPSS